MFPNHNGEPMDLGNLLNRSILPALNRCALCGKPKEECRRLSGNRENKTADHEFEREQDTSRVARLACCNAEAWEQICIAWDP